MADLEQKTTLTAEAVANLVEQFRNTTNLDAFVSAFVDQIQDAENGAFELITERTLAAAEGVQLDGIGQIVGLARGGLSDADYRIRLQAQILINLSSGTIDEILEIIILLEPTITDFRELEPATIITTIYDITADPALIASIIRDARSAAVKSDLHYSLSPEAELFELASGDTIETSSTTGLANDAGTTGGKLADALGA